jgi:predicted dehydrogenase
MGSLHLAAWNRVAGADVVAVVDHGHRLENIAQEPHIAHVGTVTDLVGQVDIAVVATPTPNHVESALELIHARIHCLVEKPLAPTERDARLLADAADSQGVLLAVGHSERFNPAVMRAGEILQADRHASDCCLAQVRRDVEYSARASSDVVSDLMVHDIDWVIRALGELPDDVDVHVSRLDGNTLQAVRCDLRFSRGRRVRLSADHASRLRRREAILLPDAPDPVVVSLEPPSGTRGNDAVTHQARAFLDALAGAPSAVATGRDAVATAAFADLICARAADKADAL